MRVSATIGVACLLSLCGGAVLAQDDAQPLSRKTPATSYAATSSPPQSDQQQSQSQDPVAAMVGAWELSNADHDKICQLNFRDDAVPGGYKLDIDKNCPNVFPSTKDIVAWTIDKLRQPAPARRPAGDAVIELTQVESGMFDGFKPEEGRYILQAAAAVQTRSADDMVGDWAIARGTGKPICAADTGEHPCPTGGDYLSAQAQARLRCAGHPLRPDVMAHGQRRSGAAQPRGQIWRFEENDANTWQRVPEIPIRSCWCGRAANNLNKQNRRMSKRHQVIIVGGGPVGVALAVELGLRGIACALVERRLEPQLIPKGQNLTQRSMEHFYFWGVADELRAVRLLPPEFPMSGIVAYRNLNNEYWYAPPLREIVNSYYFQNERAAAAIPGRERAAQTHGATRQCRSRGSAGPRKPSSKTTTACASPSPRTAAAGNARGRLRRRLRRRPFHGPQADRHRTRRRRFRPDHGAGAVSLAASCTRSSSAFRRARPIACCIRTSKAIGSSSAGSMSASAGSSIHRCRPTRRGTITTFTACLQKVRRLPLRRRLRLCRLLGSAHRGRRDLSGRPRLHRRRRRAFASALWRLRPQ